MAMLGRKAKSSHTSISRNCDLASMPSGPKCRLLFDCERTSSSGGGAGGAAESLVPPVTPDPGPALSFNGMNAAFMSFQPRESGIHAVWSGAGGSSVTEVRDFSTAYV
jgi:hypothetical protein